MHMLQRVQQIAICAVGKEVDIYLYYLLSVTIYNIKITNIEVAAVFFGSWS